MKVTLTANHEHAGVAYLAGTEIDVPDEDAAYIVGVGSGTLDAAPSESRGRKRLTIPEAAARAADEEG